MLCPVSPVFCLHCVSYMYTEYRSDMSKHLWAFWLNITEINITGNSGVIINNNLINPSNFLACLNPLLDHSDLLPDYDNPIIIYYSYDPQINIIHIVH